MPLIITDALQAAQDLRAGRLVAIPTETVYGLAAMINNESAIRAVFAMKERPLDHPLIVHVASDWDISTLVEEIPEYARQLMNAFWPGPLTLVLRVKTGQINPLVTGNQSSVAIRCPNHPLTQRVLQQLDTPLVAPSANPFGKISPTTALHVKNAFPDQQFTILDGGRCTVGIESTIINATDSAGYQILRHGLIDEKALAAVIDAEQVQAAKTIKTPGALESHYQPQKKLYYFEHYKNLAQFCDQNDNKVYAIANKQPKSTIPALFHPMPQNPEQAAFELYYQLRLADESSADCIAIELPPNQSEWQGIRERILKAGFPYSC